MNDKRFQNFLYLRLQSFRLHKAEIPKGRNLARQLTKTAPSWSRTAACARIRYIGLIPSQFGC